MKTLIRTTLILVMLVSAVGQGPSEVDRLGEKIGSHLKSKLPGWNYKQVQTRSDIVLQEWWSSEDRKIKIAVSIHEKEADASQELKDFLKGRLPQELTGSGDDAFAPEGNRPEMVGRRGRYVLYINAFIKADTSSTLSKSEQE